MVMVYLWFRRGDACLRQRQQPSSWRFDGHLSVVVLRMMSLYCWANSVHRPRESARNMVICLLHCLPKNRLVMQDDDGGGDGDSDVAAAAAVEVDDDILRCVNAFRDAMLWWAIP